MEIDWFCIYSNILLNNLFFLIWQNLKINYKFFTLMIRYGGEKFAVKRNEARECYSDIRTFDTGFYIILLFY